METYPYIIINHQTFDIVEEGEINYEIIGDQVKVDAVILGREYHTSDRNFATISHAIVHFANAIKNDHEEYVMYEADTTDIDFSVTAYLRRTIFDEVRQFKEGDVEYYIPSFIFVLKKYVIHPLDEESQYRAYKKLFQLDRDKVIQLVEDFIDSIMVIQNFTLGEKGEGLLLPPENRPEWFEMENFMEGTLTIDKHTGDGTIIYRNPKKKHLFRT